MRVGNPAENLLPDTVAVINPQSEDVLLFCFGEIDVRNWVNVHLKRGKLELFKDWTTDYLNKIASIPSVAKKAVMGIVPPAPKDKIDKAGTQFPVTGTDVERVEYNRRFNSLLAEGCQTRGFVFVDLSSYADQNGLMRAELSDNSVHIANNTILLKTLVDLNLLPNVK
jgi:hypothetical protein